MPYAKGHKYHAPRAKVMSTKHLATEIRQRIPATCWIEWHMAVASGHDPRLAQDPETGEAYVEILDRAGMMPTLEQKTASMGWLADRGFGQAPQVMHVENLLRVETSDQQGPAIGKLPPAAIRMLREAFQLAARPPGIAQPAALAPSSTSEPQGGVIDAEWEPASEPASADEGMSESEAPAASADESPASSGEPGDG